MRFYFLCAFLMLALCASAITHPEIIPLRFRGGSMYRTAKTLHDKYSQSEYSNTTASAFPQLLNHSDPDGPTFSQRWWMDASAWNGTGPAILYINGEAPASSSPTGYLAVYGHKRGAVMFTLENRYYGESMPGPLTDLAKMKQYLTVDNAIEDLRSFMTFAEKNIVGPKLRWIIVGGSYSGAVSAWFKQKYPSAVLGAWSSSGVVEAQLNFYDYDGHVGEMLPPDCREAIQNVLQIFSDMWDNETARPIFRNKFNIPSYFTKQDVSYMLADGAAAAVQYGFKWSMCDMILPQSETDPLGQYNDMLVATQGPSFTSGCYYSTYCLSNPAMSDQWAGAGYSWIFQTCTQMAYFQVGYYDSVRRSDVSTDYFINQCRSAFGDDVFPDVYSFNNMYHGKQNRATNVIALQGSDDPWSTTGIRESLGPLYPAFIAECEDCGHCGDLMPPLPTDPPSLVAQRKQIDYYMDTWLSSTPTNNTLVLNGNFSFVVGNLDAMQGMATAVALDIRNTIDQSVIVHSIKTGSLIVDFSLEVNPLNAPLIQQNIQTALQSSAWLTNTSIAFQAFGGTGNFSVGSINGETPPNGTPSSSSSCGSGCVVGILFGCVGFLFLVGFVAVCISKKRKSADEAQYSELRDTQ
jgi:pimeloyl-ACP methyl ester carboxylesterase